MNTWVKPKLGDINNVSRYSKSIQYLARAEQTIPLGSQTFSKSRTQYPVGISPHFIERAKGAYIWDLDGNRYIDLVNSLASVTLGYGDSDIENAVSKQLALGVSFSLPGILEAEVAELIVQLVPCAEMVRFGKNGTDATSAAIRIARAYTGRDHVAVCGYHGWQDWYIGSTTRDKGVPKAVSELTHKFLYNDIESLRSILQAHPGEVAAVIMEPMNTQWPEPGFLEEVRKVTSMAGAVLIFDETITGFRFAKGGAQELFGVIPDLATFGKGMANGFPLSAVVGSRSIMMEMEEIFFSGTFGGELLSLAAAKIVLEKHLNEDVSGRLTEIGSKLQERLNQVIVKNELASILEFSGHPSWVFLNWKPTQFYSTDMIRTYFMQEMFQAGVLVLNSHNVSLAMDEKVLDDLLTRYESVLFLIAKNIAENSLLDKLRVEPLAPLFRLR